MVAKQLCMCRRVRDMQGHMHAARHLQHNVRHKARTRAVQLTAPGPYTFGCHIGVLNRILG